MLSRGYSRFNHVNERLSDKPAARTEVREYPVASNDGTRISPVSVCEAKEYARINHDREDRLIASFLDTVTEWMQDHLRIYFREHKVSGWLDFWPNSYASNVDTYHEDGGARVGPDWIQLPRIFEVREGPVSSVEAIYTYNRTDPATPVLLDPSMYLVDTIDPKKPARIALRDGATWPSDLREQNAVEVQCTVGYGDAGIKTPHAIRMGIMMMVQHLVKFRGNCQDSGSMCGCADKTGALKMVEKYDFSKR